MIPRISWLFPSMARGLYLHPVLKEFTRRFPETIVFTGHWTGYAPTCEDAFRVHVVGRTRLVRLGQTASGYPRFISLPSLVVVAHLRKLGPRVIFSDGFGIWTMVAVLLKPFMKWGVVILYSGSSPSVDYRDSTTRLFIRRLVAQHGDAFVTNSRRGGSYLADFLGVEESKLYVRPYQVPSVSSLCMNSGGARKHLRGCKRPVFLYVGRLERGKGIHLLLQECRRLLDKGRSDFTLVIVGDGPEQSELKSLVRSLGLEDNVKWAGWVAYGQLGAYFQRADVFVFPTLEDVWGMVVFEAMLMGKPILCSTRAGACELICDGENGYLFDPLASGQLAQFMEMMMNHPGAIQRMGESSRRIIAPHTPEAAAMHLCDVVRTVAP